MNNSQVAHLWANEAKPRARGSNFFFDGPVLYSYGSHFVVGRIVRNKRGKRAYLMNSNSYSTSTGRHQNVARRAIASGETIFYVQAARDYHNDNRAAFKRQIAEAMKRIPSRRTADNIMADFRTASAAVANYNDYSAFFALRGRLKAPRMAPADAARADRYDASQAARRAKHEAEWAAGAPERARLLAEREAREALECVEQRAEFRAGAPRRYNIGGPLMLRLNGDTFETSQGADVPRDEGRAMLVFIADLIATDDLPYIAGGTIISAGSFTLREVTADTVTVGCHRIPMSECAAMAALVGIAWPS
jgi:hypothetical protein